MSLDDPTANDDAFIDDDLVASLGFQPSPSEGAVTSPAADTKTTDVSDEDDTGEPDVAALVTEPAGSGDGSNEETDTDLDEVSDAGLIDLASAETITLVEDLVEAVGEAEAGEEILVVDEAEVGDDTTDAEPDSGVSSEDEPLFGSGEAIELPAESNDETGLEASDGPGSLEDLPDPVGESSGSSAPDSGDSEAEGETPAPDSEVDSVADDPELLDPDEARSVATAFAELDDVEPFDFDSEVDGLNAASSPDGSDLDDLEVPLDLDASNSLVEPDLGAPGPELLDAPTRAVARVDSDSGELLDEVFAEPAVEEAGSAGAVATGGVATAPLADPSSGVRRHRKLRARKVRRVVRHVDPWSVLTFSVLFHLVFFLSMLLASILVWNGAVRAGTIDNIENFIRELGDYETFNINSDAVFRAAVVIAGMLTLASSVLVVLLTVVFNLVSDLVGGIRVTVVEEDTVVVVPSE